MSYAFGLYGMPLLVAWNLHFLFSLTQSFIFQTNEMDSSSVTLQICIVFLIGIRSCILEKYSVFSAYVSEVLSLLKLACFEAPM
jgi:hypothetical protein